MCDAPFDNIVGFRRKLLHFESPIHQQYITPEIPKYYSNFFGSWRPEYTNIECKDKTPELYPVQFPIKQFVTSPTICYSQQTYNPLETLRYSSLLVYFIMIILFLWFATKLR